MEDTDPARHLRSEYLYPSGFLRVLLLPSEYLHPNGFPWVLLLLLLPLSIHLFLCEPRTLAFGLGERLGNSRSVWLLPIVLPVPPLFLAFGLGERLGNIRRVRPLSVVHPALGLPSLLCGLVASVVPLVRGRARVF